MKRAKLSQVLMFTETDSETTAMLTHAHTQIAQEKHLSLSVKHIKLYKYDTTLVNSILTCLPFLNVKKLKIGWESRS